jgi:DNA-binding FadR family transcriptional regulator
MTTSSTLVTRSLQTLITRINDGTHKDSLPPQDVLAKDLGVGRSVMREALVILRFCNVLTIRPKTGTKINAREQWNAAILGMVEGVEK